MNGKDDFAFITGGGGSIGSGIAQACLERGWRVALADISGRSMDETARRFGVGEDRLMTVQLDVSDPDAWERAAQEAENRFGAVSRLFNNAGVQSGQAAVAGGTIETLSVEEWRWTNAINYDGVFFGLKTFVPRFKASGRWTHIVNTSSVAAIAPLKTALPLSYAASKAAVAHMAAQLRTELAMQGVTNVGVSVLYPGRVTSDIVKTSLAMRARDKAIADEDITLAERPIGIDPLLIGRFTLAAMDRGDFHIFSHPEWGERFLQYRKELDSSFKDAADPEFSDPSTEFVDISFFTSK